MLKAQDSILKPDSRFMDLVFRDNATGDIRAMRIDDLHALIQPLDLNPTVPEDIRQQFDAARHAFVYSWFAYELATLAEQQSFAVVEMALRSRYRAEGGKSPDRRDLKGLLEISVQRKWLRREDFEVSSPGGAVENISLLQMMTMLRNRLAHGNMHLLPYGSLEMLRLCAEIVNKLFPVARPIQNGTVDFSRSTPS